MCLLLKKKHHLYLANSYNISIFWNIAYSKPKQRENAESNLDWKISALLYNVDIRLQKVNTSLDNRKAAIDTQLYRV